MWLVLAFVLIVSGLAACNVNGDLSARTDFVTDDPVIERLLKEVAAEWAKIGVANAELITVNEVKDGMPIRRVPRSELPNRCYYKLKPGEKDDHQGCVTMNNLRWDAIYIPDDQTDERKIRETLMHELGHILSESEDAHIPNPDGKVIAVMTPSNTAHNPTELDRQFMAERTIMVPPADIV